MPYITIYRQNKNNSWYEVEIEQKELRDNGVFLFEEKYNSKTQKSYTEKTKISTAIYIDYMVRSESGNYYCIKYFDREEEKTKYISAKDLFLTTTKNSADFDELIQNGLKITEKCRSELLDYLKEYSEVCNVRQGTDYVGWTKDGEYITNGFNTSDLIFTGSTAAKFEKDGDATIQKKLWESLFIDHPIAFGIIAYCYTGFLAVHLNEDNNPILAMVGTSSLGKSTIGKIALSGFTNPKNWASMNSTQGSMQSLLQQYNDSFVFFDETGESPIPKEQRIQMLYSIANGKEKGRLRKFNDSFKSKNQEGYKYSLLIGGEESLIKNLQATEGIKLRLNEIVLSETTQIFDFKKPETKEEEKFNQKTVELMVQNISDNYGHIIEEYIERLKKDRLLLKEFYRDDLDLIRKDLNLDGTIANRKAKILAYIRLAAKYLADIVITDKSYIPELIDTMYLSVSRAIFESVEISGKSTAEDKYIDLLTHFEQQQQQYFTINNTTDPEFKQIQVKEIWGEIEISLMKKTILIMNNKLIDVCSRLQVDEQLFLNFLINNGLLITKNGKKTIPVTRNGGSKRYYKIEIPHSFLNDKTKENEQREQIQEEIDPDMPQSFLS